MVQIFADFTSTLVFFGVILALGTIFEKPLIKLEDKIDEWAKNNRQQDNRQKTYKTNGKNK